jgi:hypothetical protein
MAIESKSGYSRAFLRNLLNKMNNVANKMKLGDQMDNMAVRVEGNYDFSVSGGATGEIALLDENGDAITLPDNAIVYQVILDVATVPDSAGDTATVGLTSEGAVDLLGATAEASVTGILAGIPVGTAATMVKMTAAQPVTVTIATEALTSGKFKVFIDYVVGG